MELKVNEFLDFLLQAQPNSQILPKTFDRTLLITTDLNV